MTIKPKRPCNKVGCRNLTDRTYCPEHEQQYKHEKERYRKSAYERGYDSKWQRASKRFLQHNPLCACDDCKQLPVALPAEVTDHIVPHKGDMQLFWDPNNWQPMNKRCHDRKTVREDGGFGNGNKRVNG